AADPVELQALLWWVVQPLAALWLVGSAMLVSRLLLEGFAAVGLVVGGMIIVVAAMFLLPPLIAFAAYFCLLHSFGHLIDLSVSGDGPWRQWTLRQWTLRLWPATAGAIALGLAGWLALTYFAPHIERMHEALGRTIFWGLAALTVPHVLLHEAARRERRGS
ncbi:MAG: hypothetical protein LC637_09875, partial [Xanthomonadaceae bacterium]|nr:hypothetical protein [Xanthomonadaceae bacterium]